MKLYEALENQLKKENNFVTDEGELKKWVVVGKARNYEPVLIKLLLENNTLKEKFFVEVEGTLVFKQEEFITFMEMKNYLNDSYTQYKNKVGLTIDGKYLKQRNEVALVWPFKDCVLEGGQTKEEQKREEIFFNEILAHDEITQLFEPKVLSNAKVYDKDGVHKFSGFTRDAELNKKRGLPEDTITDNMIIKGNNLLALHSLKKEFVGKVKLIYIDPPYNTGNDGFKYNDSFNHSTWLTFMKNRLEVARSLLKKDGSIFVHCDDNEQAYLKLLLDEIFGPENFISNMVRMAKTGGGHDSQFIAIEYDYVLIYAKNKEFFSANKEIVNTDEDPKYKHKDEYFEKRGRYYLRDLDYKGSYSASLDYPIEISNGKKIYAGGSFGKPNTWRWSKQKFEWGKENGFIVINEEKEKVYIKQYQFVDNEDKVRVRKIPYRALIKSINSEGAKELSSLFNNKVFDFPKPEGFMKYIFDIASNENDIVLDYHLGSGTTAAVAHKTNRQYIGIEQMDYIESVVIERLKKVMHGDNVGVSKSINWIGGGTFTYFELKKYNQIFIEKITTAKNSNDLLFIWEEMKARSFLTYNVDIQELDKSIKQFKQLHIDEQKKHLIEILDKNQLYVNLSSLNDVDYKCSNDEKCLTKDFYNLK